MTLNVETTARDSRVVRRSAARTAILEAARRLSEREGVDKLSLSAVATEANFGASTVFGHFRNKDELLLAIVAEDLATLAALMRQVRDGDRASQPLAEEDESRREVEQEFDASDSSDVRAADNVVPLTLPDNATLASQPRLEPTSDEPQRPRVDAWLERRLRVFEHTLADLDRRLKETESGTVGAEGTPADPFVAERLELFERQQSDAMQELTRRLEETEQRQRGATAEMRAAMNDSATRIEILESARRSEQERVFGRRSSDAIVAGSPPEAPAAVQSDAEAAGDPEAYEEAARRATTAAAMLADMDRKPAPPKSGWQRFTDRRVRLQRRHYLMAMGAGLLAFVLGAFLAFHAGEAKGRTLSYANAVHQVAVHHAAVHQAKPYAAAPTPKPVPLKAASAASPLDRLAMLAQGGNAKAELLMGLRYLQAPAPDQPKAADWIRRAADQHEPLAQYWLGTLYEKGDGVAADASQAVRWYEAAAGQGNRKAMHALGVAYAEGLGTQKDYSEAARWFTRAAALGLVNSEFNLGVLYERGLGVPQSLLDAYKWYAVAAAQGDTESRNRIEALKTQLSADDLAAAERAAQSFAPQSLDARANSEPTLADLGGSSSPRH